MNSCAVAHEFTCKTPFTALLRSFLSTQNIIRHSAVFHLFHLSYLLQTKHHLTKEIKKCQTQLNRMTDREAEMKAMTKEVSDDDDRKTVQTAGTKRPASNTEDDKKAERRAANRRSAFQSRQRRKILIEDLQKTVSALSNENTDLRKNNEELRVQLEATLLENHQFRVQQQLGGSQGGVGGLLGASSLHSAQAQALLRGQGGQATIAQLLGNAAGGSSLGAAPAPAGDNDPLLNARLALAAAQNRVGDLDQNKDNKGSNPPSPRLGSTSNASSQNNASGLQGILDAATLARVAGGGVAGNQLSALQGLLQGGAGASQLSGLQSLLDAQRGPPAGAGALQGLLGSPFGGAGGGLTDIQRAILQGAGGSGASSGLTAPKPAEEGSNNAQMSDALRNLLQRNQGS